jgi:hypothetical protein
MYAKTQQNQKTRVGRLAQFISFFIKIEMKYKLLNGLHELFANGINAPMPEKGA